MANKSLLLTIIILLLSTMLMIYGHIRPLRAVSTTWTVDDDGPADFPTIQEAIDAANAGDTIYVFNGTYYENLIVAKSIKLLGEDKVITIVDGGGQDYVIQVTSNNVVISGFTVRNSSRKIGTSHAGIKVMRQGCNITDNLVTKNRFGIFADYSERSKITANTITNNAHGISLYACSVMTLEANDFAGNTVGIFLALSFDNTIVKNKVENGSAGGHGIILSDSYNNTVLNNHISRNFHGMWLPDSYDNMILNNTIANNALLGIELANSMNNAFYHNIFINNPKHVVSGGQPNVWDNDFPSGGNYWDDYKERYPNATERNGSGIWDTPYVIDNWNQDNFPLIPEFPSTIILLLFMMAILIVAVVHNRRRS